MDGRQESEEDVITEERHTDATLLILKMEEGTTRNGICFWKLERARRRVLSWSLQKEYGPADTLILDQRGSY